MSKTMKLTGFFLLTIMVSTLAYCTSQNQVTATNAGITEDTTDQPPTLAEDSTTPVESASADDMEGGAVITIEANGEPTLINACLLGTNLPAWLGADRLENSTFQERTIASGVSLIRLPGGSWSNWYPWLDCEQDNDAACDSWIADPTDFINFLNDTGLPGMWSINPNATSKEAAALVAFMNGSVNDNTLIGVDVQGQDWGSVGEWAQLRTDHGNPDPLGIQFWEIGNEIYGGKPGLGTDCPSWGWEDVWTCDGTEYVNGIGSGINHKEGFIEFREAMRAVDPSILVGAVGIYPQAEYANWGNEVIAAGGEEMDFYILHQYAFFEVPANMQQALSQPHGVWEDIRTDVNTAFAQHVGGRDVPVAMTEHNLFSVQDLDNGQWLTRAVNALFMADTLGQMMQHGFDIANQWDLANGQAGNGTDYGLMHADSYARSPQYYVFPLWAQFGSEMLPVTNSENPATTLSVYAGRMDGNTLSLLAINKTGNPIAANISINGINGVSGGLIDVVQAQSLDATNITYNGSANPSNDLSNAPSSSLADLTLPIGRTFPPYSITLIRLDVIIGSSQIPDSAHPGGAHFALAGAFENFLPAVSGSQGVIVAAQCGE
jgi:hypothetical protein